MAKKIDIAVKRGSKRSLAAADAFVSGKGSPSTEKPVRITIDLTPDLHRRFKIACVEKGEDMAVVLRGLMEKHLRENK